MIYKILEKLAKPMKHPFLDLILFYIISLVLIVLLLSFDLIKLKTAEISMLLCFTVISLVFYCFKGLCIEYAYENKASFIPGMILTFIAVVIILCSISWVPNSTKTYTKTINLKNGKAEECISVSTDHYRSWISRGYDRSYIHCKVPNNKTYKIELEGGTKINWKKGMKNKVELIMSDEYSAFGNKIDSKATAITIYYEYR